MKKVVKLPIKYLQMADIEQMIDQEGPKDGQEEEQGTPRELSTPTQDEAPNPIEGLIHTLAPGVSASGVQAAASALKDFVPLTTPMNDDVTEDNLGDKVGGEGEAGGGGEGGGGGMDEISDEELLENNEDLGNLAVKPVQENDERLSNVSSISNSSKDYEPSNHRTSDLANKKDDQDDEVSLSGLSSPDENELKIRSDVEDGEINDGTAKKKQNQSKDSSDSSDQENNSRQRRRFRKRSETSENRRSLSKSSDSEMRQISPR